MENQRSPERKSAAKTPAGYGAKARGLAVAAFCAMLACSSPLTGASHGYERHTREHFRHTMALSVRADHPVVQPVAAAIRAVTLNPLQQLVMVNDVTHLLVDYDDDERVYGPLEFHATFDEMLERRREGGWLYLRDDCDGRAVFAAHLLAALGIEWRLEASFWKEHAWIVARVGGVEFDLLDLRKNAPEIDRVSYKLVGRFFVKPSQRPPAFAWRRAWADHTGRNLATGLTLGLLALDSSPGNLHQRYATDWTQRSPRDRHSPLDPRALTAAVAGFPYGEPIKTGVIAGNTPRVAPHGLNLGVTTGSPSSTAADGR